MVEEKSQYISLQEATKYCNYSQEYLSLRIRQGKLRGKKFARNWVTKKEWLDEYLKEVREYNCNSVKNGFRCQHRENFIKTVKKDSVVQDGLIVAQKFIPEKKNYEFKIPLKEFSVTVFTFACFLIFCASIFSPSLFQKKDIKQEMIAMSADTILQSTSETFLNYVHWVGDSINHQIIKIKTYAAYLKNFGKKPLAVKESDGMVVVPSTVDDETLKEQIRNSFSDEIKVEIKDDGSGIITPVFKEREGDKYLYLMVPLKN